MGSGSRSRLLRHRNSPFSTQFIDLRRLAPTRVLVLRPDLPVLLSTTRGCAARRTTSADARRRDESPWPRVVLSGRCARPRSQPLPATAERLWPPQRAAPAAPRRCRPRPPRRGIATPSGGPASGCPRASRAVEPAGQALRPASTRPESNQHAVTATSERGPGGITTRPFRSRSRVA